MNNAASLVLSAYSFIIHRDLDIVLNAGVELKNGDPIPSFDEELLIDLCSQAEYIFASEKNTLEIEGNLIVVGDIHGSLYDLFRILKFIQEKQANVLFLGDYVDRGSFSLECITILFALKVTYPDSVYLIRGNHEFDSMCSQYGFKDEILNYHKSMFEGNSSYFKDIPKIKKSQSFNTNINNEYDENYNVMHCYKYSERLYEAFIRAFSYLPISAIVNKTSLCIHGGLSPKLVDVDSIDKLIKRPIFGFEENSLLSDIVWSDPSHCNCCFDENPRGKGKLFNGEAIAVFLKNNNLTRIIRGHQCVKNGLLSSFGDKCITVFSASSYNENINNSSSILELFQNDDTIRYSIFDPIHHLSKNEVTYYKVQALNKKENNVDNYFSFRHPVLPSTVSFSSFNNYKHKEDNFPASRICKSKLYVIVKPKFTTNKRKIFQNNSNILCQKVQD